MTNPPAGFPRIVPHLIYDDVAAAIDWLTSAFGFHERTSARHTFPDGTNRLYQTADPAGHHWTFAQHVRDVDPAEHH